MPEVMICFYCSDVFFIVDVIVMVKVIVNSVFTGHCQGHCLCNRERNGHGNDNGYVYGDGIYDYQVDGRWQKLRRMCYRWRPPWIQKRLI